MSNTNFDSFTIEPNMFRDGVAVYGHGVYPNSSVLAGQSRRSFLDSFDTAEAAKAEWPHAEVIEYSTRRHGNSLVELSGLPAEPPGWFDAADAGETW